MLLLAHLIEFGGALVISWFGIRALFALLRKRGRNDSLAEARLLLADGVVTALSLMTAATLLKSTALGSWSAIGLFAAVLAIRTGVKRSLAWELGQLQPSRASAAR